MKVTLDINDRLYVASSNAPLEVFLINGHSFAQLFYEKFSGERFSIASRALPWLCLPSDCFLRCVRGEGNETLLDNIPIDCFLYHPEGRFEGRYAVEVQELDSEILCQIKDKISKRQKIFVRSLSHRTNIYRPPQSTISIKTENKPEARNRLFIHLRRKNGRISMGGAVLGCFEPEPRWQNDSSDRFQHKPLKYGARRAGFVRMNATEIERAAEALGVFRLIEFGNVLETSSDLLTTGHPDSWNKDRKIERLQV